MEKIHELHIKLKGIKLKGISNWPWADTLRKEHNTTITGKKNPWKNAREKRKRNVMGHKNRELIIFSIGKLDRGETSCADILGDYFSAFQHMLPICARGVRPLRGSHARLSIFQGTALSFTYESTIGSFGCFHLFFPCLPDE